jgi:hypothetical protein
VDVKITADEPDQELRDKFAAAALTALLSNVHVSNAFATRPDKEAEDLAQDKIAREAYRWADAMLKARDAS